MITFTTGEFIETYSYWGTALEYFDNFITYNYSDLSKPEFEQKTVKEIPKSEDDFWKKDFEKAYK